MGDVVMTLLLEKYGLLPGDLTVFPASLLVTLFDSESLPAAYELAADLRRAGMRVAVYTEPAKLSRQFRYADKIQARLVLVLGPDEMASSEVTVKDLHDGSQRRVTRSQLIDTCHALLEPPAAR
jgi:histidyl-tRNA synthetase